MLRKSRHGAMPILARPRRCKRSAFGGPGETFPQVPSGLNTIAGSVERGEVLDCNHRLETHRLLHHSLMSPSVERDDLSSSRIAAWTLQPIVSAFHADSGHGLDRLWRRRQHRGTGRRSSREPPGLCTAIKGGTCTKPADTGRSVSAGPLAVLRSSGTRYAFRAYKVHAYGYLYVKTRHIPDTLQCEPTLSDGGVRRCWVV